MARASRARLSRMASNVARGDWAPGPDRWSRGAWSAVCAFVSDALVRAGIDPARARALRPAPSPDSDESEEAGEFVLDDADSLAGLFAEKIAELVRRYEDRREPDFAKASLAELFAWCLAQAQNKV